MLWFMLNCNERLPFSSIKCVSNFFLPAANSKTAQGRCGSGVVCDVVLVVGKTGVVVDVVVVALVADVACIFYCYFAGNCRQYLWLSRSVF